jgi:hypothetical protein
VFLPSPRVPGAVLLPPAALCDELLPGSGDLIRAAHAAAAETVAAVQALEDGRPGGSGWEDARRADRASVIEGGPATGIAALLATDPGRYGTALALCSTLAERCRVTPPEGLAEAADETCAALFGPLEQAIVSMARAHDEGRRGDALKAKELAESVMRALADRQAVARWARGSGFFVSAAELPRPLVEAWQDVSEALDGVPLAEGWRIRQRRKELAEQASRPRASSGVGYPPR